jgi:carboxylate-amine ligase
MKNCSFKPSKALSLGVELEWQLLDNKTGALVNKNIEALTSIKQQAPNIAKQVKPEVTQNIIEINSSVHHNAESLLTELVTLRDTLFSILSEMNLTLSGGGAHPYSELNDNKIYPTKRYAELHQHYGYLIACFAIFSEQIHIGCESGDDAIYLIHALGSYIPHFIALSASSPYYFGVDTYFNSSRLSMADSLPTSGTMPYLTNWQKFQDYLEHMVDLKLINSIKDAYWDIRPQSEIGTIEIRVCDCPLTITKAASLAAFAQSLCAYLLETRPALSPDTYLTYRLNRFSALRYGLDAKISKLNDSSPTVLRDDLLHTFNLIKPYAKQLGNQRLLAIIEQDCLLGDNDAKKLKAIYEEQKQFQAIVKHAMACWQTDW